MTGTAETERQEFFSTYKLDVVVIPTNREVIREDSDDVIFRTKREKYNAIINEALAMHEAGRPVLVGTVSVDVSQRLSEMLSQKGVPIANWLKKGDVSGELSSGKYHTVLNAKYHKQEAEIVSKAGAPGIITIATNMAGRGTDIKLPAEVVSKGGLHIIGSEKHEARRIDRQLRGRSGRQGDPGSSRFYLSLEDDLMRLFGSDRITTMMSRLGPMEEGERIEHPWITKSIERAQKKVEERNFEIRKNLLEYDTVLNEQRKIIYKRRQNLLGFASAEDFVESKAKRFFNEEEERRDWNLQGLIDNLHAFFNHQPDFTVEELDRLKASEIKESLQEWVQEHLDMQRFFSAMQLRHRLLGFCRMEDLIAELVRLKIHLHDAGGRDTTRWNINGIELTRIFNAAPDWLQVGGSLGDAEAVERRLVEWAQRHHAELAAKYQAAVDLALFHAMSLAEMVDAFLAGLMMIHLSPTASPASWNTEEFLNDLQRTFGERPELGVNELRTIRRDKVFTLVRPWMTQQLSGISEEAMRHRIIGFFSATTFAQMVAHHLLAEDGELFDRPLTDPQRQSLRRIFGEQVLDSDGSEQEERSLPKSVRLRAGQIYAVKMREQMDAYRDALIANATIEECIEAVVTITAKHIITTAVGLEVKRKQLGNALEFMLLQRPAKAIPETNQAAELAAFVKDLAARAVQNGRRSRGAHSPGGVEPGNPARFHPADDR